MNKYDFRKRLFDLREVKKLINEAEWMEHSFDPDIEVKSVFLGTVFQILPSGKFYMPWTTNQTQEDVERDSMYFEKAEAELNTINCYLESGEGDPCDLFIMQCRDKEDICEA